MKKTEISVKENRQHSSGRVPFSYYESKIPTLFPYVPLHWHNEWELNVITDGAGTFRLNEQEVFVKEGDVLLIQPRVLHAMETTERLYYDTVVFRSEMLGMQEERSYTEIVLPFCTGQEKILPITRGCPYYDSMRASAETVVRCAEENTAVSDILMKSELLRLLWCLRKSDATRTEEVVLKSEEVHLYDGALYGALKYRRNCRKRTLKQELFHAAFPGNGRHGSHGISEPAPHTNGM